MTTTSSVTLFGDPEPAFYCVLTYNPYDTGGPVRRVARTGFWLSLFRFQGATGHTPAEAGVGAGCPRGSSGRRRATRGIPSAAGGPGDGLSDGSVTLPDARTTRQRAARVHHSRRWADRATATDAESVAGHPLREVDARRQEGPGSRARRCAGTDRWHAVSRPALRMPPGARSSTGFPLRSYRQRGVRNVRRLLMPSKTTHVTSRDDSMMDLGCCTGVTAS